MALLWLFLSHKPNDAFGGRAHMADAFNTRQAFRRSGMGLLLMWVGIGYCTYTLRAASWSITACAHGSKSVECERVGNRDIRTRPCAASQLHSWDRWYTFVVAAAVDSHLAKSRVGMPGVAWVSDDMST
jgi:hypothetical protein